jgi:hypothetical protein
LVVDDSLFKVLNDRERFSSDKHYVVANFNVNKKLKGIISYMKFIECDQPFTMYSIQTFDGKGNLSEPLTISSQSFEGYFYKISFKFKNDSTLLLTEETSSQWVDEKMKTDTMFQRTDAIDLSKLSMDTLNTSHHYYLFANKFYKQ